MNIFKKKKIYLPAAIILIVAIFAFSKLFTTPKVEYNTAKAELGTLRQTITETGTVKRLMNVNLNFLSPGRLANLPVKVGDRVKKGQVLAELDYTNLKIQVRQAEAGLDIARANQQKIINGAISADISIGQKSAKQAEDAYKNSLTDYIKSKASLDETVAQAEKNLNDLASLQGSSPIVSSLVAAQTNLDNTKKTNQKTISNRISAGLITIHDKNVSAQSALDSAKRILTDENAKDTLGVLNQTKLTLAQEGLLIAQRELTIANNSYDRANLSKTIEDVELAFSDSSRLMSVTLNTLNLTYEVLVNTITGNKLSQAGLDALKATANTQVSLINSASALIDASSQALGDASLNYDNAISSAQQNLNTAKANYDTALQNAKNALKSAELNRTQQLQSLQSRIDSNLNAWQISQSQFSKIIDGSRPEDVSLAVAQVKQAQANLDAIKNQINNSIIKAPFDGEITQINYEVGEEPNATKPVIVLLGKDQYKVDVLIAESDIAKVAVGNQVEIDFDAFGENVKFNGQLNQIDPAQTVIQEVVYYNAEVGSLNATSTNLEYLNKIRPGMTANITIMANQKDNVVIAPFRAVLDQNGQKIIRLLKDGQVLEVQVKLGMRGDDGLVEIINGISVNDEIILSIKNSAN